MRDDALLRAVTAIGLLGLGACDSKPAEDDTGESAQAAGVPSTSQVPLDPATIPKFAHELTIPPVYAPREVRDNRGRVIRREYDISMAPAQVQMLPPGFPTTTVFAYGGNVVRPDQPPAFARTVPGPTFESTRNIPNLIRWKNDIRTPGFMPVDPTIHWANPQAIEPPVAPFNAFPPGYEDAQFPVAAVVHTHGLMVQGGHDGTAEEWFTAFGDVGPNFVTKDYLQPNDQPSQMLWYHGHTVGVTRLDVYSGLAGANILRDPNNPLERAGTPLPTGKYEIPLVIQDRGFFTDGELNFARTGLNPGNPYWTVAVPSNTNIVNGRVWPNLTVDRRQYRFRLLIAPNERTYTFAFDNNMPFTVIGSDGGYLPQPKQVTSLLVGISERADIVVDFSSFAPGTKIVMLDTASPAATLGTVMQFTVNDTPPVPPVALPTTLNPMPTLVADAPQRNKVLNLVRDADNNVSVLIDGLHFTQPTLDYPLVGSTEQWNLIQNSAVTHLIHIHLIEFQVIGRQAIDAAAYNREWLRVNGTPHLRSRPIFVDPTPFFVGAPIPPTPYETGWKDTIQAPGNQITRIMARWAPQAVPTGGSTPGVNQFSIDPTTDPGYLIHCHLTGHEDHDMLRRLVVVNRWRPNVSYKTNTVVELAGVNYRVLVAHNSRASEPPTARFDLWERVNNNDGSWQPQINYAVDDRVTFQGRIFSALKLHQARVGQEPPAAPQLWHEIPATACGQLTEFCAGNTNATAVACVATGQANTEATCLTQLQGCLNVCQPEVHDSPCSGLCENPIAFSVPDGTTFRSPNLGGGAACYETLSKIDTGTCQRAGGRTLRVNGVQEQCNNRGWPAPLPPERNEGYCIQVSAGGDPNASFTAQ